jgi:hypothetical protein
MREEMERFNEWWFTGKIRKELAPPFKRHAFPKIMESLKERQVLIITGLRRVGKTTLLYQTIEKLLETEEAGRILYFSFDEFTADPRGVLEFYEKRVLKRPIEEAGKVFVFFDEVQYSENWPAVVKQFYDLYPNVKFFISGSSSLLLSKDAVEKLAGRFFFQELKPLGFSEFLEMKGIRSDLEDFPRRAEAYFFNYLTKAGFPEIVDMESETKIAEYIRNSVVDRIVFKDLPGVFKTRDLSLPEKLVGLILSNPGATVNLNELSKSWGVSRITVSNHLKFLETSLLVRSLGNFRPSFMSASRKLRKYYPATTSLIFSHSREVFERNTGRVLETYVANALGASFYFRKGRKEIDVILGGEKPLPIEVKATVDEKDLKNFSNLLRYVNADNGIIVSLNQRIKKGNIEALPAYLIETFPRIVGLLS